MNRPSSNDDHLDATDCKADVRVSSRTPRPARDDRGSALLSRTVVNFWLDATMLVVFVLMVWAAAIVRFVFPPAVAAREWTLWSWNIDQWIGFQYATTCVFTFLIILHLMLHWTWICGVITSRLLRRSDGRKHAADDGTRTLWGVGLLIVLLHLMGLGIALAVLTIQGPQ
jgi:hypothetical protein